MNNYELPMYIHDIQTTNYYGFLFIYALVSLAHIVFQYRFMTINFSE